MISALVSALPVETWWIGLLQAIVVVNLLMVAFAYTTWLERKLLGRMQLRYGPNRAGPYGLLQPIADLIKLVRKESFFPDRVELVPWVIAPVVAGSAALAAFAVIPFGPGWTIGGYYVQGAILQVPIALIFLFALGSLGIYGFITAGWASDSKYALLGSMRACAQLVSYEVSLALSVIGCVIMGRSLSLQEIVVRQGETIPYAAPQFVGLVVFFVAGLAETSRTPFDLPEADGEIVAGYHTEYGGMRWGMFQTAEYINMITISALMTTLFFSGWHGPPGVTSYLAPLWFVLKTLGIMLAFIWVRASLPRLRYDQLMRLGWKVLLPVATLNAVVTAACVTAWG